MRQHFQAQSDLQIFPIEKIQLPIERRDKLPTILADMDLWQILGLGGGLLGLDSDWDRLEHIATYDLLVRQMLGVPATPWGRGHQSSICSSNPAGPRRAA